METVINYIRNIIMGIWGLFQGLGISMKNFIRPKVTEQYPENRGQYEYFGRFRAQLTMPHNAGNEHKCTSCGICRMNCPNGTIRILTRTEIDPETGKEKRALDRYMYNIGSCIFCDLCVSSCPSGAIAWSNDFEHSVFNRTVLEQQLNRPGSKLESKKKE